MPVKKDDGGQVYPDPRRAAHNMACQGITRRDWLAGLAMQGMLSDSEHLEAMMQNDDKIETIPSRMAVASYKFADAMIAESNK